MRSLFSRLFISFLFTMVVAGIISTLVFFTVRQLSVQSMRESLSREFEQSIARFLRVSGQAARDTFQSSGIEAYRTYLREFEAGTGTTLRVINEKDADLAGLDVPAILREVVGQSRKAIDPQFTKRNDQLLIAIPVRQPNGENLVIAGIHQMPPPPPDQHNGPLAPGPPPPMMMPGPPPNFHPPPDFMRGPPPEFHGGPPPRHPFITSGDAIRMGIMVLAAAAVCLALAKSFSVPLTRLRTVTRQIAGGDFSVRVGDSLKNSATELVNLGRDFDQMAEATEKMLLARQRLFRDISHELRSPLARLKVALELARKRFDAPDDSCFLSIDKESDRLNELIGHILYLARLDEGAGQEEKQVVDLKRLVQAVVDDADFEFRPRGRGVISGKLEDVEVDGSLELLRRAVENIVRNAASYTREGTQVEVTLQREQDMALIEVRDCGPGVPEEELKSIFLPFYRIAAARERESGGTGLGLAIAAQAVQQHQGQIEAVNRATGGLIVRLRLPAGSVSDNNILSE